MHKTAYEMRISDWSSDVCSSDLHEFLMLSLGVIDQGNRRLGNTCQQRYFARMVHAQLKHGSAMLAVQTQYRPWCANIIIQVAAGRQTGLLARRLPDN